MAAHTFQSASSLNWQNLHNYYYYYSLFIFFIKIDFYVSGAIKVVLAQIQIYFKLNLGEHVLFCFLT